MNKKTVLLLIGATLIALVLGLIVGRKTAASAHAEPHAVATSAATTATEEPTRWTCSMHPQIQQREPGKCPICGMDLIPLQQDSGADEGPRVIRMSKAARALADIQTTQVIRDYPTAAIRLVGKLDYDETREKSLTARFPARIDELYVNFTGIQVKQGEHLAKVYSPELLTAQQELLTSYRADPNSSITAAARAKLQLWDLLPEQIAAIIESDTAKDHFVLKAPIGGVVADKHVKEGDYLKTGEPLFKIVDLSELWALLDAYESDLPWLRFGQEVTFTVESLPGETFRGQVAFIEPEVDRQTRTIPIRVNVLNNDRRLKPGMFVRGIVAARLAEDGHVYAPDFKGKWISPMHPEVVKDAPGQCDVCGMNLVPAAELGYVDDEPLAPPLIVPTSAVLRTGKRAVVYVENPNSEQPTYTGREIVLGPRAGAYFIVASGLTAGERVVTNGAFKIDSALQIQAQPSMMHPAGNGATPEHEQDAHAEDQTAHAGHTMTATIEMATDQATQLLKPYLALQAALAADDLPGALAAAKAMMAITGHPGALSALLHDMLAADSLDALRRPAFEQLSNALIAAVRASPASFTDTLFVMHCPMVYDDRGADWLQISKPLQNPYFGASMLQCGYVEETIGNSAEGEGQHAH